MKRLVAVAMNFKPGTLTPVDPKVFEAAQVFMQAQFGERYEFGYNLKSWAAVDLDSERVVGAASVRMEPDVPLFHVEGGDTREERKHSERARDLLASRVLNFIQDSSGAGKEFYVHVDPMHERMWRGYLRLLKAKPANRFIVTA